MLSLSVSHKSSHPHPPTCTPPYSIPSISVTSAETLVCVLLFRRVCHILEIARLLIGFVVTPEQQQHHASESGARVNMHANTVADDASSQHAKAELAASCAATSPVAAFLAGTASVPKVSVSGNHT